MGLDMYFYVSEYKFDMGDNQKNALVYPPELKEIADLSAHWKSISTKYLIGYFRKFNALHKWIVNNCAGGEDDCRPVWIAIEQVRDLISIFKQVLEDHTKAKELLPSSVGFFFGSTDYDEWYYSDVEKALELFEKIEKLLKNCNYDLIYEASW